MSESKTIDHKNWICYSCGAKIDNEKNVCLIINEKRRILGEDNVKWHSESHFCDFKCLKKYLENKMNEII